MQGKEEVSTMTKAKKPCHLWWPWGLEGKNDLVEGQSLGGSTLLQP
jgi:hypothetical protein